MDETWRDNPPDTVILMPVYNDWVSLRVMLKEIGSISTKCGIKPSIVVVDDGSDQPIGNDLVEKSSAGSLRGLEIIRLHLNIGHQSAIAVGLSEIYHRHENDLLIVMDADGEDRPEDIERLILAHEQNPGSFVVAQRSRRTEGYSFQILYLIYKIVFRLFVGSGLDYGNFCLIPRALLGRLAFNSMSWNHLAASISRSGIKVVKVRSDRGKRFHGRSGMSIGGLISHGLRAVSVYLDVAMVRVLILSILIVLLALLGISSVIWLRLLTDLAIPGWATSAVGLLSVIGLQGLVLSTVASFLVFRSHSGVSMIPAIDASKYIDKVERIWVDD